MRNLDWLVVGVYFVALIYLVFRIRRAKNISDFAVAGRAVPGALVASTLAASFLGPGYTMGLATKVFDHGLIYFFAFLGFSLQTILVGLWIAPKLQRYTNAFTVGGIVGQHYGRTAQAITGVLSVLFCIGIVGVVAKACGDIVSSYSGLPSYWAILLATGVVVTYSTISGVKAVVSSDAIQFIVLSIGVAAILILGLQEVDINKIVSEQAVHFTTITGKGTTMAFVGIFVSFVLGECLVPPYTNRALISKTPTDAKKGFVLAGVFSIIWFFACAGIAIIGLGVPESSGDSVFLDVMNKFLPVGFFGLVIAAIFSIIMSTADSFLNAGSVSFTYDVLGKKENDDATLKTAKILNLVIGVLAVLFAFTIESLVDALVDIYLLWAPTVVPILILGLFLKKPHRLSGLLAIIAGGLVTGLWEWAFENPFDIPSVIPGIVANQLVFWIVQLTSGGTKTTHQTNL